MKIKAELDMSTSDFAALSAFLEMPVNKKKAEEYFTRYIEWVLANIVYDYEDPDCPLVDFNRVAKVRFVPDTRIEPPHCHPDEEDYCSACLLD